MKLHVFLKPTCSAEAAEKIRTVEALINEAVRLGILHPDKDGNFDRREFGKFLATVEPIDADPAPLAEVPA